MDIKPLHILEGWYKSKIVADPDSKKLSQERLSVCMDCEHPIESKVLKFINGSADEVQTKKCGLCKCPLVEKSLVKDEKCDAGKWKR